MSDYCDPADLYSYGLPRGALPNSGRPLRSASASADTFALDAHGFDVDDALRLRAEAGGSLPLPLEAGVEYFAIPVHDGAFKVSATAGGAAIDLQTNGSNFLVIAALPIAKAIAWASRVIDDMLPSHLVPLALPVAEIVRMTAAELAANKLLLRAGAASKSLTEIADQARKRLERWSKGVPIRGENAPEPAGLATSATATLSDARGWNRFGGL